MMPVGEPPDPIPSLDELRLLIDDAAVRATAMLGDGAAFDVVASDVVASDGTVAELADAIRMLASPRGRDRMPTVAARAGLADDEIRRLLLAWRHGGQPGVLAALGADPAPHAELDEAVRQVRALRVVAAEPLEPDEYGVTDPSAQVQVRWGPDRRWYPFTNSRNRWWPASGAAETAGQAYRAALRARRAR